MTHPLKFGLVLLLVGGSFCLGRKNGPEHIVTVTPAPIERVYRDNIEPNDAAALRDCNDALSAYASAIAKSDHWRDPSDHDDVPPPPALRYRNPEGEVVTYKILPLRGIR